MQNKKSSMEHKSGAYGGGDLDSVGMVKRFQQLQITPVVCKPSIRKPGTP